MMFNIFKKIKFSYILSAIFVSYLGITSFCSATNYTIISNGNSYNPSSIGIILNSTDFKNLNFNLNCPQKYCGVEITNGPAYRQIYTDGFGEIIDSFSCNTEGECLDLDGTQNLTFSAPNFDSVLGLYPEISFFYRGEGGEGGEGGNEGGNLIPNGTEEFEPVINGLSSAISEFISYVVYVGIGLISALLGFFAIKRLIRYVRNNSLSVFSSRKKRK